MRSKFVCVLFRNDIHEYKCRHACVLTAYALANEALVACIRVWLAARRKYPLDSRRLHSGVRRARVRFEMRPMKSLKEDGHVLKHTKDGMPTEYARMQGRTSATT